MSSAERRHSPTTRRWQKYKTEIAQRIWTNGLGIGRAWSFRRRRVANALIVILAFTLMAWLSQWMHASLMRNSIMTGWTLLTCLMVLFTIGIRRRIPVLPLGTMSTWTQIHVFTGLFALGVFALHVPSLMDGRWIADGILEGTLSVLFLSVSGSGLYGVVVSRRTPIRLTAMDEQPRYDQIDWHREQLAWRANQLLADLNSPAATRVLGEFHHQHLQRYFAGPLPISQRFFPHSIRRRRLVIGLKELHRYLEDDGKQTADELSALVRRRDDLDTQHSLQWRLRAWVVVHAAMSVILILLAIMHTIHALRFVES